MVGEESEGFSMKRHLPEKDGILAVPDGGGDGGPKPARACPSCMADLFARVGPVYNRRLNLCPDPGGQRAPAGSLKTTPASFAGLTVEQHVTLDGHKYLLEDGSWVCFRPSGTEPVVRFYFEASSPEELERLRLAGESLAAGSYEMPA